MVTLMRSRHRGSFSLLPHIVLLVIALFVTALSSVHADIQDPFDPFDSDSSSLDTDQGDDQKSSEELLMEANILLAEERLLDARTKLLKVLKKDPKEYRAHMMLAGYYMQHVNHFRLALKYVLQAANLFREKNGEPPYRVSQQQTEHAHLLYLLSQARLNLDNYSGALQALDEYTSYNYYASWYPGTRAWVLMKLKRVDEAIKVARMGVLAGAEPGRTLNMLGILLSMNGERENSLRVFNEAIAYEMALGTAGQPATPLNNSGEVYKETFLEEKAEASWLKATRLPDGCEHVLPSLNLSLLYIDQLNFKSALSTIRAFEGCVAQYALRNGEEHRALVHLAKGRIYLHAGNVDEAIKHLEAVLEERQWFGKIGTSEEDLRVGAMISLAQALSAKNHHLELESHAGPAHWMRSKTTRISNSFRSWWLMRRARQVLIEDLNDMEDLYIRNTDSMIEYPTFGELLAGVPRRALERRLNYDTQHDGRPQASVYYKAYLAENYLHNWRSGRALQILNDVIDSCRPKYDDLLKTHALLLKTSYFDLTSDSYADLTFKIFSLNRSKLRNYGYVLPVNFKDFTPELIELMDGGPLYLDNTRRSYFTVTYDHQGEDHSLYFMSTSKALGNVTVKGTNLHQVVDKFMDAIFIEDVG